MSNKKCKHFRMSQIIMSPVFVLGLLCQPVYAGLNQFDVTNSTVGLNEFMSGGPAKDGIPSLDEPKFISVQEANYLQEEDRVIGVVVDGQAKAYPINILNWHEIVNDHIADRPIAVTWCPLTRSAVTFDRTIDGQTLEFGVSGLLYNSNVVMYDRHSQGLWSQLKSGGLTGPFAQDELNLVPTQVIRWKDWKEEHPESLVLSNKTGHWRNYNHNPYADYHASERVMFPVEVTGEQLRLKALIVGVQINGVPKAYPLEKIAQLETPLIDQVDNVEIRVQSLKGDGVNVRDKDGNILPSIVTYWFAWKAFHADTLIY